MRTQKHSWKVFFTLTNKGFLTVSMLPYLAHQPAVTFGFIVILRHQNGMDNARYPKANGENDTQYKGADAPGC